MTRMEIDWNYCWGQVHSWYSMKLWKNNYIFTWCRLSDCLSGLLNWSNLSEEVMLSWVTRKIKGESWQLRHNFPSGADDCTLQRQPHLVTAWALCHFPSVILENCSFLSAPETQETIFKHNPVHLFWLPGKPSSSSSRFFRWCHQGPK